MFLCLMGKFVMIYTQFDCVKMEFRKTIHFTEFRGLSCSPLYV